jgi:hypothetical protein
MLGQVPVVQVIGGRPTAPPVKLKEVTDGTSNCFMFFEQAGVPDRYDSNGAIVVDASGNPLKAGSDGWADDQTTFDWGQNLDDCGYKPFNCHNGDEIYSFHQGGSMFTMGDGSTKLFQDSMDPEIFTSLFTRNGDDIVDTSAL